MYHKANELNKKKNEITSCDKHFRFRYLSAIEIDTYNCKQFVQHNKLNKAKHLLDVSQYTFCF